MLLHETEAIDELGKVGPGVGQGKPSSRSQDAHLGKFFGAKMLSRRSTASSCTGQSAHTSATAKASACHWRAARCAAVLAMSNPKPITGVRSAAVTPAR
jgi:hypothetical protein